MVIVKDFTGVILKKKKCKNCLKHFIPERQLQSCCSFDCSIEWSRKPKAQKAYKMEKKKELIEKYPDKSKWLKVAEKYVNTYIRLRDLNNPCCSCGHFGDRQFHAGHFMNVGCHQQLRFHTLNIHKQCSICNNWKSSNNQQYRPFMINKYGLEFVESLESNQERGNYTVEYLQRLIKVFRKKIKLYERKFRRI